MDRRRFLKASAIMGTAVTVGDAVLSSIKDRVFAKEPEAQASKSQGATPLAW
jgi:nitrous oxide reductase